MNKNDLRYLKTEKILEESYIALKKESSKPVKLVDLCNKAMINKTTFYKHYETMDDFVAMIQKKTIKNLLGECKYTGEAFTNTKKTVTELYRVFKEKDEFLNLIFENDFEKMMNVVEKEVLKIYLKDEDTEERKLLVKFAIGGASKILTNFNSPKDIDAAVALLNKLLK